MKTFYRLDDQAEAALARAEGAVATLRREAAACDREGSFPKASLDALGEAGLHGLTLPRKVGGLGQGPRAFAAVAETLARECASTGMCYVMHVCAVNTVAAHPTAESDALLRAIAEGRHLMTLAFSEKGSRSHFWAPVSKERAEGGKTRLTAEKSWVTSAGDAAGYVVSTLSHDAKTPVTSSLYHVRQGTPGLSVAGRWDGLGLRANGSAPMTLQDVELDQGARASEPGKGFDTTMGVVLPWFVIGSAAISCGIAEAALAATVEHLKTAKLEHLGETLSSLPNLRANVAKMRIEIDRARAHLVWTIGLVESGAPETMLGILSAKTQAAEMAIEVTDLAMRTCGGAAFSKHLPIERAFRDARASSVMAPTTDVLRDFLGKAVLGMALF